MGLRDGHLNIYPYFFFPLPTFGVDECLNIITWKLKPRECLSSPVVRIFVPTAKDLGSILGQAPGIPQVTWHGHKNPLNLEETSKVILSDP